jgi:predicted Rossmann fold nucleotide-binding protein DprA/Smf involved in DNA uptake
LITFRANAKEEMMKQLKKDLKAVAKDLKKLTQKTDKMVTRLERLSTVRAGKKPKAKAVKKPVAKRPAKVSPGASVLAIIKRSRKGIDIATLRRKTGLEGRKLGDLIYRLKKQGKIKTAGKGSYVKA